MGLRLPASERSEAPGRRARRAGTRRQDPSPSHILFAHLKDWLRATFHGVSKKHMPHNLDELSYRLNQRWNERARFGSILG
ncbi:MAG TPA: transposase [Myxococcota bacterium]|nr:transposase [Myxococcota bacterium]